MAQNIIDLVEFYLAKDDDDCYFPESPMLINPERNDIVESFLDGVGAVAVAKLEDNKLIPIFFTEPECSDNYPQLDFTQGRFSIYDNRLNGRFEEFMFFTDEEQLDICNELIQFLINKFPCLKAPEHWDEFYIWAKQEFKLPDWRFRHCPGRLDAFLAYEYFDSYRAENKLTTLLEAEPQDLRAINAAILDYMKGVETPNDDIRVIYQDGKIMHLELWEQHSTSLRKIYAHTTKAFYKQGLVVDFLPLCCLKQEPNGDRIVRGIENARQYADMIIKGDTNENQMS